MTFVNRWYSGGLAAVGRGDVVLITTDLVLVACDDTFDFDDTHLTLADVTGALGTPGDVLGTRSMVGPYLATDTDVSVIPSVPTSAEHMTAVLLCTDGATDADRVLLHCWFSQADTTVVDVVTDNGDVEVQFYTLPALGDPGLYAIVKI